MLARFFQLQERNTKLTTEILAGLTTFMTMAYIIFVNPTILNFVGIPGLENQNLGPGFNATMAATCLTAGVLSIAMGLFTNYPFTLAAGMGLNAVVAFQLILGMKLPWQSAMGVIFLEGAIITVLVLTGVREAIMRAIPLSLKRAIGVGIGLFILFIGLYLGGIVQQGKGIPMTLGDFNQYPVLVTFVGIAITVLLLAWRVRGAILFGIVLTTLFALFLNHILGGSVYPNSSVATLPKKILEMPDFSTLGAGFNWQIFSHVGWISALVVIFSIMLSDFFDTMGTVIGVGGEGKFLDEKGNLPGLRRVLFIDSLGAMLGGISSSSSVTTYVESASGVAAGGRTGLTSIVAGICFLLCLFIAPIAGIVPQQATAAALLVVGFYMCEIIKDIPFHDLEEGLPSLAIIVCMPFTYSITNGIGLGFLLYVFIKVIRGKCREVHPMMYLVSLAFAIYFLIPVLQR